MKIKKKLVPALCKIVSGCQRQTLTIAFWHFVISKNRILGTTFTVFHHCHLMSYDVAVRKSVCKMRANSWYINVDERAGGRLLLDYLIMAHDVFLALSVWIKSVWVVTWHWKMCYRFISNKYLQITISRMIILFYHISIPTLHQINHLSTALCHDVTL